MKPVAWHFPEDDPVSVSCAFAKVFGMKCSVLNSRLRSISFYLFTLNFSTETVQAFLRGRLICNHFMEKKIAVSLLKAKSLKVVCNLSHIWRIYFCLYGGGKKNNLSPQLSSCILCRVSASLRAEREGSDTIFRQGSQEQAKAQYIPWSAPRAFALPSCKISIGWCGVTTWLGQQVV